VARISQLEFTPFVIIFLSFSVVQDLISESTCGRRRTPARIQLTVYYGAPAAAVDESATDECYMDALESRVHRDSLKSSNSVSSSPLDNGTAGGRDADTSRLATSSEFTARVTSRTAAEDAEEEHSRSPSVAVNAPVSMGSLLSASSAQRKVSSQQKIARRKEKKQSQKQRQPEKKTKEIDTGEGEEVLDYVVHYFDDDAKNDKIEIVSAAATHKKMPGNGLSPGVNKKGVPVPVVTIDTEQVGQSASCIAIYLFIIDIVHEVQKLGE